MSSVGAPHARPRLGHPAAIVIALTLLSGVVVVSRVAGGAARIPAILHAVVDGDTVTLLVHGRAERARLIGIDAPELAQEPWGPRARDALAGLLRSQRLSVELDVQPRDRHGRLLVYLFAGETFVNERMLLEGFAVLLTIPPNVRSVGRFTLAQQRARAALRGVWAPAGGLEDAPSDYRADEPGTPGH